MIFNCINCGVSISSKRLNCTYCRASNAEIVEVMEGRSYGDVPSSSRGGRSYGDVPSLSRGGRQHASINNKEKLQLKERAKGTIFSFVLR